MCKLDGSNILMLISWVSWLYFGFVGECLIVENKVFGDNETSCWPLLKDSALKNIFRGI